MSKLYKLVLIPLCLSLCTVLATATNINDARENEAVEKAAIEYLDNLVRVTYLYEDIDLTSETVLADELSKVKSKDSLVTNESNRELEYIVEKANYLKAMRSMNGLYRTNFDVSYSVEDIAIQGERATAEVTEYINFQYVGCDFMSGASNSYTVELVKYDYDWVVAKVDGGDFYVGTESQTFDYEKEMATLQQAALATNIDQGTTIYEPAVTYSTNYRPYIGANAAAYAQTYTDTTGASNSTARYNANFKRFADNDCQNFASQSVWAGFGGSNSVTAIEEHKLPMDTEGSGATSLWYGAVAGASDSEKTPSWTSCEYFRNYITGNPTSSNGIVASTHRTTGGFGNIVSTPSDLLGTVLHVTNPGHATWGHAVIVTQATSLNRNGVYFSGHTSNRLNYNLQEMYGSQNIYVIVPSSFCNTTDETAYVYPTLYAPQAAGNSVTLKAAGNRVFYELNTVVTLPNGTSNGFTYNNTSNYSRSLTLSATGIYKITIYAKETSSTPSANRQIVSYTIRVT